MARYELRMLHRRKRSSNLDRCGQDSGRGREAEPNIRLKGVRSLKATDDDAFNRPDLARDVDSSFWGGNVAGSKQITEQRYLSRQR